MKQKAEGQLRRMRKDFTLYRKVMADPRCPVTAKLLLGAAAAYAFSPLDLIPDFIPVLGYLDDLLVVTLLVRLALGRIPAALIEKHRSALAEEGIGQSP
jgi:uncharacterized membrane protein YkvA (DUF1232 family)